jgi:hypothetical protein
MSAQRHCPECGAPLLDDAPEGLCPACLVKVGLIDPSIEPTDASVSGIGSTDGPNSIPAVDLANVRTLAPRPAADSKAVMPERLVPGEQFGNYKIVRRLGSGGMGTVFEAEEQPDGRRLALKVLNHSFDSPGARLRFLREGRLAAAINHPNSVYVYGTEEIADMPVITMELVRGGTLEELVRSKGRLSVGEAVDAVLQVISGLEAAADAGILHRDIKPSNCFIDADGTIKVGDFGLSISTVVRSDSQLVDSGTFMGTPSFASPEQFRGELLDVRSDIYSVGVTLFYLLTGRAPLEAPDLLRLMVAVLERSAPDLCKTRPDVPAQLARVVARCLKKSKEERYQTYAELRKALEPFGSATPWPAKPLPRMLAGLIDFLILFCCFLSTGPINVFLLYWGGLRRPILITAIPYCTWLLLASTYFALPEWLWGASVGKAICRVKVVGFNRQSPTFLRAYARAMFYFVVCGFIEFQTFRFLPDDLEQLSMIFLLEPIWPLVLFVTARRKNGFAALHDLLTGTRVVTKTERESRIRLPIGGEPLPEGGQKTRTIGPYAVLSTLKHDSDEEWSLGYDPCLLRKVWIRESRSAQAPRGKLALISRNTRIRWLAGQTTKTGSWDAFEAVPGRPLLDLLPSRPGWAVVRYWLFDLANELTAASADHTLPDYFGLDRVLITTDGRAKLMDFSAWRTETDIAKGEGLPGDSPLSGRTFLAQVAMSTLEGRAASPEQATARRIDAVLPLHARAFLDRLPEDAEIGGIAGNLRPLLSRRATITRARRFALVAACGLWPFCAASMLVFFFLISGGSEMSEFDVERQRRALERLEAIEHQAEPSSEQRREQRQLELCVSYYDRLREERDDYGKAFLTVAQQDRREQIRSRDFDPRAAEVAAQVLGESFKPQGLWQRLRSPFVPRFFFLQANGGYVLVVMFSVIAAVLFRGLARHALGIVVVNQRGAVASRLRLLLRTLLTWSLVIAIQFALPIPDHRWLFTFLLGAFFGGAAWSVFTPTRSVQDWIARTWLVPR